MKVDLEGLRKVYAKFHEALGQVGFFKKIYPQKFV